MQYLETQTKDGLILRGLMFETTAHKDKKRIVVHIHGMSSDLYTGAYLTSMYKQYLDVGISLLTVELRGTHLVTSFKTKQGFRIIGGAYEKFEESIYDIQAWVQKVKKMGYKEVWLQGASLAPSKLVYYLSKVSNHNVNGLILLSPADILGLVKDPVGKKDHKVCFNKAKNLIQSNRGNQLLPCLLWGQKRLSANTYLNYFSDNTEADIFNYKNLNSRGWKRVEAISIPVIAFSGTKDEGITPVIDVYKAMDILKYKLLNSPRKKMIVLKGANHDFEGFGDVLARKVVEFIIKSRSKKN